MAMAELARVPVGPFGVLDASYDQAVGAMVELAASGATPPARAFALHVGGLGARNDARFVTAMNAAEMTYADGAAVVAVAKVAGAERIERTPTTDAGWDVLRGFASRLGRLPVVSIVGGPQGLAERALAVLTEQGVAVAGLVDHGFHDDWTAVTNRLAQVPCDVLVVGLGAPREMLWVTEHLERLPGSLVLTCGGWLGFLAGEESRAPLVLQRLSMEWAFRLSQSPRRLFGRYAKGALVTARLIVQARRARRSSSPGPRLGR